MANEHEKGTGKHPHKSSEEPFSHQEAQGGRGGHEEHNRQSEQGSSERRSQQGGSEHSGSESNDLKEREYRDKDGNVHHHTTTYQEQHKGENR